MMAISLTPPEQQLRDYLIGLARSADPADPTASTLTYGELATAVDHDAAASMAWRSGYPRYARLITALYHVNSYEVEHGRPMVGAFAVSVDSRTSGTGFTGLARELGLPVGDGKDAEREFWRSQIDAAVAEWQAPAKTGGLSDSQFDALMAEMATVKRLLRTLIHG